MELDQEIYEKATSPNQELDILITLCDAPALEEIRRMRDVEVKKVFQFINTIVARMKVKDILDLSHNPTFAVSNWTKKFPCKIVPLSIRRTT